MGFTWKIFCFIEKDPGVVETADWYSTDKTY